MTAEARPHPHLRLAHEGAVLTVTLANPDERNAQTPSLWRALAEVAAAVDPGVRVVVLRAEGQSFSAGLHRGMLSPAGMVGEDNLLLTAAGDPKHLAGQIAVYQRAFVTWRALPAVVVAAVQGHAIGAGFQLALAADLRVLADDAVLAMRETSLGLVPDLGGTKPLVEAVGYARALEICATGRAVGAAEAAALGLANLVVPRADLEAGTDDLVAALLQAPEQALRELKAVLRTATASTPDQQCENERHAQARLLTAMVARRP
ncbi:enoyl-CoA hydratase/isomerase family protein [Arsenicicoccus piscis]|uniref:enoyl-CoA hydratase/isomerase family protein n=1 Tax=Arsenicicoccus piscis TaxID=673954 RepID=UPI001F4CF4D1|nr:enoyl-CoA hydratase/isomerase family protein [Arsenicicoccus piscis]MCH8628949.1 enoyl-CoA hydratase/isomerase family protein [Arsenicicoccus piscis]